MGTCARCLVEDIIRRYGRDNVIETISDPDPKLGGWIHYKIYTVPERRTGKDIITVNGRQFQWMMTLHSEQHSLDEDCWRGTESGFPDLRLTQLQNHGAEHGRPY